MFLNEPLFLKRNQTLGEKREFSFSYVLYGSDVHSGDSVQHLRRKRRGDRLLCVLNAGGFSGVVLRLFMQERDRESSRERERESEQAKKLLSLTASERERENA